MHTPVRRYLEPSALASLSAVKLGLCAHEFAGVRGCVRKRGHGPDLSEQPAGHHQSRPARSPPGQVLGGRPRALSRKSANECGSSFLPESDSCSRRASLLQRSYSLRNRKINTSMTLAFDYRTIIKSKCSVVRNGSFVVWVK